MFASPAEQPPDFDPRSDDCVYGRYVGGTWSFHTRSMGKWSGKKVLTNAKWQGMEIAKGSGMVPPGVPCVFKMDVAEWESLMDGMKMDMTYEQATS